MSGKVKVDAENHERQEISREKAMSRVAMITQYHPSLLYIPFTIPPGIHVPFTILR